MTTTDGFYCNVCRKDVICDVASYVDGEFNTVNLTVSVAVEVTCKECGNTILTLGAVAG